MPGRCTETRARHPPRSLGVRTRRPFADRPHARFEHPHPLLNRRGPFQRTARLVEPRGSEEIAELSVAELFEQLGEESSPTFRDARRPEGAAAVGKILHRQLARLAVLPDLRVHPRVEIDTT